jgi:hypothetical protein
MDSKRNELNRRDWDIVIYTTQECCPEAKPENGFIRKPYSRGNCKISVSSRYFLWREGKKGGQKAT